MKKNYFIGLSFFFTLLWFSQYIEMLVSFFEAQVNTELISETNPQYAYLTKNEPAEIVEFNYFYNEAFEEVVDETEIVKKAKSNACSLFSK